VGLRIVALVLLALAQAVVKATPAQAASEANVTKPSVACPSQNFNEFLAAFSESADLQRRYTFLPLQYGDYVAMPGSAIKWRKIKKIEDIPYFDPETQLVFRNNDQRAEKNLDVNIEHQSDGELNEVVILKKSTGITDMPYDIIFTSRKMAVGIWTRSSMGLDPEVRKRPQLMRLENENV
jgi:hypothetical protein